jgi:hypothetical protein
MPLDDTNFILPAVKPATFDPVLREGLAGLAQLSEALRHPEWWAARNHKWAYRVSLETTGCGTAGCAIGVAKILWPAQAKSVSCLARHEFFAIDLPEDHNIFFAVGEETYLPMAQVTPAMVADAIDALLAAKGWKG